MSQYIVSIESSSLIHYKSRKETPQKLTQLSSRSHPRHLVGKRIAQKDITIDTTSDSQVNSNFLIVISYVDSDTSSNHCIS